MATLLIAQSEVCTALLNYDPVGLTASSVIMANTSGQHPVTFWISVSGVLQQKTAPVGTTTILTLSPPLAVVNVTIRGVPTIQISNLDFFGAGVGSPP